MTLQITTIISTGDDVPNSIDYFQMASAKETHQFLASTGEYPYQSSTYDKLTAALNGEKVSQMGVKEAQINMSENGYTTCIVPVDSIDFLEKLVAIEPIAEFDIFDYLHDLAFDFGYPNDPEMEIVAAWPKVQNKPGIMLIKYTTKIDEFLDEK